jgi:hypothetical protein
MSRVITCQCGANLQLPDAIAGKRVQCPACGRIWRIAAAVVDAEPVPEAPMTATFVDDASDEYRLARPAPSPSYPQSPFGGPSSSVPAPRRPCPECGEMIPLVAMKCRFCDASFDDSPRRRGRRRDRSDDYDEDMNALDWLMCFPCPGVGCIVGIVYLAQGRTKGSKMIVISILFAIILNVLNWILGVTIASFQGPQGPP